MKKLSHARLAETVIRQRKAMGLTQIDLAGITGINRSMIGRIESEKFRPSTDQLEALAEALNFDVTDL